MSGEQPARDTREMSAQVQQCQVLVLRVMTHREVLLGALEVFVNEKVLTGIGDILLRYVLFLGVFG